ncbi:MAG: tRNA (guanosine(37)-N1)-methyltransferase TrmD [Acidobacteriota bacterium]
MKFHVITIFPEMFQGPLTESIIRRAIGRGLITIEIHNLRDYAKGTQRQVDDTPFGGGGGMVLKPEPIFEAVEAIKVRNPDEKTKVILLCPQGRRFDQEKAEELSGYERIILICGRYEGVDERVRMHLADEELSIGDFVITGGELAAMIVIDAMARLIPGVLGDPESPRKDSFSARVLGYPLYTRPADFRGMKVPDILLSGNHSEIERWRKEKALEATIRKRPDLMEKNEKGKDSQ